MNIELVNLNLTQSLNSPCFLFGVILVGESIPVTIFSSNKNEI